ncbi:MAG: hypothetical protein ACOYYS_08915 [Chloroflexota bacterium]
MKKSFPFLALFVAVSLACNLPAATAIPSGPVSSPSGVAVLPATLSIEVPASATALPATELPHATPTALPATELPYATPTVLLPSFDGLAVSFGSLKLVLPPGLAAGASGMQFGRAEGEAVAPWEVTPGHIQLDLDGYVLQGKFHEPQIFVYPAQGYAELQASGAESIQRLHTILDNPAALIDPQQLPRVPFFNAGQVFASNIQVISFQNGRGVRFLTEYAQYAASANNHDLFYHFQGLTDDGAYYIIAILPVTAPVLAENSDAAAPLPAGGVAYPDIANPNADWQAYYAAVANLLNATHPETFAPMLGHLDLLVQSIQVVP